MEVITVGFARKRIGRDGEVRYLACYRDLKGQVRSAGTFASQKQADKAWQRAEAKIAEGRVGDPARGRMIFRSYVEDIWLPNHQMEPSTREGYTYAIYRHIMPEFGRMRMVDILPEHVREWITKLQSNNVKARNIKYNKNILSAIFTTALNDQVTWLHPCKGVKTPPVPRKPLVIISPTQFDCIYQALPDVDAKLLVETDIESGLRWGELTELRVKDLNFDSRVLTVSRAVVEVNPKFHPEGKRFWIKEYPKDREYRRFKISAQIVRKLQAHRDSQRLDQDDLLFAIRNQKNSPAPRVAPNPDELGLTPTNGKGLQYKHGTLSGYNAGQCRCEHCRAAYAIYRAQRRAHGKDNPRTPRTLNTDGHIPNDWFRRQIWQPTVKTTGLTINVRIHDLRHAHASWLQVSGVASTASFGKIGERLLPATSSFGADHGLGW